MDVSAIVCCEELPGRSEGTLHSVAAESEDGRIPGLHIVSRTNHVQYGGENEEFICAGRLVGTAGRSSNPNLDIAERLWHHLSANAAISRSEEWAGEDGLNDYPILRYLSRGD